MRQTLARSTRLGCWGLGNRSNFWEDSQRRSFGRAQRGVFDVDVVIWMHIERAVNHQLVFCHIAITCRHVDAHLKASGAERCPCWRNASRFGKYHLRLLEPSQPIWLSVMNHDTRTMWIYVTPAPPPHCHSFLLELMGWAVPCLITGIHLGESQAALNDLSCLRGSDKSLCSINQSAFPWTQSFLTGAWVLILILNICRAYS